jgi:hypothetical protein
MVPGKNFRDHVAAAYARAGVPREVVMTVPSFTAAAAVAFRALVRRAVLDARARPTE